MSRMQITKQAVAILSPISGNARLTRFYVLDKIHNSRKLDVSK